MQQPQQRPTAGGGGDDARRKRRDEKVQLIEQFYKALNGRDYHAVQRFFSDEHLDRTWFGNAPVKPQAVTRIFDQIQTASPDWYETLDEIISVDDDTGWVVFRATGRGSITGSILGLQGQGNQIATPIVHCVRIVDGKFVEYRSNKPGGFENPITDPVAAPADVQAVRAEQGGGILRREARARREDVLASLDAGEVNPVEATKALAETDNPRRCQALLAETGLRCLKAALPGSIYCEIHEEETPEVHRRRV